MIIWLASYPRSGNTFLRVVLKSAFGLETYSIYGDRSDIAKDPATTAVVGHQILPEEFDFDAARDSEERYLIKTHELPRDTTDKVIYLIRDGRESTVSYLNYIRSFHNPECHIDDVLFGNVPFGSWAEHVKSWSPQNSDTMLMLKFEELTANPLAFLKQLSDFIGAEEQGRNIPDFAELHKVNPEFFRQGRHDSWREELTSDEVLLFWLMSYAPMKTFYPNEIPPGIMTEAYRPAEFSELFCRQSVYYGEVVNDLKNRNKKLAGERSDLLQQKDRLSRERDGLVRERDDLSNRRMELAKLRDELLAKKSQLESLLQVREGELSNAALRRGQIESVTVELTLVKAWKSPLQKYRAYKKLLQMVLPDAPKALNEEQSSVRAD